MKAIIKTQNLVFKNFIFYKDIEIPKGQVSFLTGASGVGKSTLFKLINKTAIQSDGQIFYDDKNIEDYDATLLRKEIMLINQDPYLFSETIKGNFDEFYDYLEKPHISDDEIKKYLMLVSIDFDLTKNCDELSGGEKHRVFIAIHLSLKPKVILLDEPTSALDKNTSLLVIENVVKFCNKSEITLVVISHDNDIASKFSDKTISL